MSTTPALIGGQQGLRLTTILPCTGTGHVCCIPCEGVENIIRDAIIVLLYQRTIHIQLYSCMYSVSANQ